MDVKVIDLEKLLERRNIRTVADDEVKALAESMKQTGQEVEIRVYPAGNGSYFVKSGHRRVAAAKLIGWTTLRAVVDMPPQDEVALVISQFNENSQRKDLSYMDKARVYEHLKELGMSNREIARTVGETDQGVSMALKLVRADPKIQKAVEEGRVSPSAIEPLLARPLDVQARLADAAIQAKTVRRVAALIAADVEDEEMVVAAWSDEEEADPLEQVAAQELEEALAHLRQAALTPITDQSLRRSSRPTVAQLVEVAHNIKQYLEE
jgi:ParB/RepB/Spo0J family partition protein